MKLISLNTWGGRVQEPFDGFIRAHATTTDVFCFQEVHASGSEQADESVGERPRFFEELQALLPDFAGLFAEQVPGTGIATFVHKRHAIAHTRSFVMLTSEEVSHLRMADGAHYYPRVLQVTRLADATVSICNFHGVPGKEKKDSPERALQSERLRAALRATPGPKVLVGDFNLRPDTSAVRDVEQGMRNLVIEGGFSSTRTLRYEKRTAMPYADYTFVTPDVDVRHFEVMSDDVSDHSPMSLEFEVFPV